MYLNSFNFITYAEICQNIYFDLYHIE